MLQIEQLTKSFGDRVLFSDISFSIERGQKVGLIAPNGRVSPLVCVSYSAESLRTQEPSPTSVTSSKPSYHSSPISPRQGRYSRRASAPTDPVAQLTLAWEIAVEAGDSQDDGAPPAEMEAKGAWHL